MPQNGSLIVRVFVSRAQLPIRGATVITALREPDGKQKLLSIQTTDESGIAGPISLPAPEQIESDSPNPSQSPFSSYTLVVEHPNYQLAVFENLQIFPGVETVQNVAMIPLSIPEDDRSNLTIVTPQPL